MGGNWSWVYSVDSLGLLELPPKTPEGNSSKKKGYPPKFGRLFECHLDFDPYINLKT